MRWPKGTPILGNRVNNCPSPYLRLASFGQRDQGSGPLGKRGTRDRKATRLGFNSRHAGEPTPHPGSPSFGFSDVPWREQTGMFVNSVFLLFSCFLEGRNMKRLAQRFTLDSDSFSRDGVRKKKKSFLLALILCWKGGIILLDFSISRWQFSSSPTIKLFWLLFLSEKIIELICFPTRFPFRYCKMQWYFYSNGNPLP